MIHRLIDEVLKYFERAFFMRKATGTGARPGKALKGE